MDHIKRNTLINIVKYDIAKESIINASLEVVYNAVLNGSIAEWIPLSAKRLSGESNYDVGAFQK